jgi:hypothetical protein
MPAALGDKSAVRFQGPADPAQHRHHIGHPVQDGVRKDGIELAVERQRARVDMPHVEPPRASRRHHPGRRVDANHGGPERRQLLGERAVAASEIENPLAWPRGQQSDNWSGQVGDEPGVGGVIRGVPSLCRHHALL